MAIAIGDIHGCLDELQALVAQLPPTPELVFLGDYVDRGPESAQVLQYLERLAERRPCRLLMGNHEAMMASAIAERRHIALWTVNGGARTLTSYGMDVHVWARRQDGQRELPGFAAFHDRLAYYYEDEAAIYVHAGVDPDVPNMAEQEPEVLLWIREAFFRNSKRWRGKPIVFGHTPTRNLGLARGEIFRGAKCYGIDTGCVYGGGLTAFDPATGRIWQERTHSATRSPYWA